MRFEWIVALRFLREGRFQSALIVGGTAIGVAVVIFITGLIVGMQTNTVRRVLSAQAHVVAKPPEEIVRRQSDAPAGELLAAEVAPKAQRLRSIDQWQRHAAVFEATPGVIAVSPTVSGPGFAMRGEATKSVAVLGIEPERYNRVVPMTDKIVAGSFRLLSSDIAIGKELAKDLGVDVGDKLRLVISEGVGDAFTVSAIFDLGIRDLNRRYVFLNFRTAQALYDLPGGASSIDLAVAEAFDAERIAKDLAARTGLTVESWMQTNSQLLTAINAQDITSALIRFFTLVIVALGIASVLVVSVVQKRKEIGILRAMGASRERIQRVFLLQGAIVGLSGAVGGSLLGTLFALVFRAVVRNPDGTPLFPIELTAGTYLVASLVAVAFGLAAAAAPARAAAALDPAAAIRG